MIARGAIDEKVSVYRQSDHGDFEATRGRHSLASNIRRKEKGLSQERLAELAGMHRTFISLIERRGRNVTLGVVEAIAVQLGVDVPLLLTPNESSPNQSDTKHSD